jgi:hypothetical protein
VTGADLARMVAGGAASLAILIDPSGSAHADEPCAQIVAPTELPAAWAGALADLGKQIEQLPATECQAMTLLVEPREGGGMQVVAMTRDGRRAERTIKHPESLVAMALGLLMTIPGDVSAAGPAPVPPPVLRVASPSEPRQVSPATGEVVVVAPKTIALWAGLSAGIRLTAPTSLGVLDVEARADLLSDRWLLLATLRSALVSCLGQQGIDCDVYRDVIAGMGVGRRFNVGAPDLDVAFEPSLAVMRMEYDGASGGEGQMVEQTEVVLRFDLSARLVVPIDRHWALTLTIDGGLAPSVLASPIRLPLPPGATMATEPPPPFPAWSGGARLGASGALL